jgi:hypothetical protein
MLHVATVHWRPADWIDIQIRGDVDFHRALV